ncbi:5-formyltetrahydrofolate cyclo-ligase family protein [Actinomyces bovis]|uniref:5-formyltetrahydrofolate cyclo-ligase n=1 Tax=Actinomyces bovis TaxID=1658 RepID=A0ABY1VRB6_9ACTO|nr:5-formyltetrahydrofolate cyclo-ligase [Actinomyces bovis]SPT54227.1 5-formyltetrahydrofolate cyclo-ligase family protein [Actinomyces bovis]VEG56500.1 5-formyltetrahydrofolate cyclo-ligase family protein [Actinomyces israelii]
MTVAPALPDTSWLEKVDAKERLRQVLREHRRSHHPHPSRGHNLACEALTEHALEAIGTKQTVACYVSTGSEPCTRLLLERLHEQGVQVLLPVLGPRLSRAWGWFKGVDDLAERAPRRPPEPSGEPLEAETIALAEAVLVPALAIDPNGNRLGQGGGWYDRMLPLVAPEATVFGVVHPEELVRTPVPVEAHDNRVDAVITAESWFLLQGSSFKLHGTNGA